MGTRARAGITRLWLGLGAIVAILALTAAPASASKQHLLTETFGPAAQPSFGPGLDLAVDHSTGDLFVATAKVNELQRLTVSATAGQFHLRFGAEATSDLPFNATREEIRTALDQLPSLAGSFAGGRPVEDGAQGEYLISFEFSLANKDLPQLVCEDGAVPLSGGSGCSVSTLVNGAPNEITRWHADGTPAPFAALGANTIDAQRGPGGKPCAEEASSCDENSQGSFGGGIGWGESQRVQVAVDESSGLTAGDIYVTVPTQALVDVFAADGHYLGQITKAAKKALGEATGLAVAPDGTLYVASVGANAIFKYTPSANPPLATDATATFTAVKHPQALAIGTGPSAGALFVVRLSTSSAENPGGLFKLDASSGELDYALEEGFFGAEEMTELAVDPANGDPLAAKAEGSEQHDVAPPHPTRFLFREYDASGPVAATLVSATKTGHFPTGGLKSGLAASAAGQIYALGELKVGVYGAPVLTLPDATTEAPTAITPTRATLHGSVVPDGLALTECGFEYLTEAAIKQNSKEGLSPFAGAATAPCAESPAQIGSGASPVSVHADLTGLTESEEYEFRLHAANANGADDANGPGTGSLAKTLNTKRTAETEAATEVSGTAATLNGFVNPDGAAVTECLFEWGKTEAPYEHSTPCAETEAEIGAGTLPVPVHLHLTGLEPNQVTYHFRLHATTTANGPHSGADLSFKTAKTVVTEAASQVGPTAATLNGSVNPLGEAVSSCRFELADPLAYQPLALHPYANGTSFPCAESEAEIGAGSSPVPVHASASALNPGTTYHFRLLATTPGGTVAGEDLSFTTPGPAIAAEWARSALLHEATLRAEIDPQGAVTEYQLEYGETTAYGQSTAPAEAGASSATQTVTKTLEGLQPDTTYHYRFTATSHCLPAEPALQCTDHGPDHTFTTYPPAPAARTDCPNQAFRTGPGAALPDCRAYELVSPLDKNGGDITVLGGDELGRPARLDQATPGGDALTYSSYRAFAGSPSSAWTSQYLGRRGEAGWSTESLTPPQEGFEPMEMRDAHYKAFSEDLCSAWVIQDTEPLLAPGASAGYPNLYRRANCGSQAGGFEALSTVQPNVPAFEFGSGKPLQSYPPNIQGFSADGSLAVFASVGALIPGASTKPSLYVHGAAGGLLPVCVLPDGSPYGGSCELGTGHELGLKNAREDDVFNAVSADGSRVLWSDAKSGPGRIYLRSNPLQPQSAVSGGQCSEAEKACTTAITAGPAFFRGASEDGSRLIFYSTGPGGAAELFETELEGEGGSLTVNARAIGGGVAGVMGISADATRVYFVSHQVLSEAPNGRGQTAQPGGLNLYLYHAPAGAEPAAYTFIATLSSADLGEGAEGPFADEPYRRTSRVSADGQHAAFISRASLTGYDNTDQASGRADFEVYLYDAGSGDLACVSCNPSGARPRGREFHSQSFPANGWIAAQIPGWENDWHAGRVLAADGSRLFFESLEPLVLRDTNGAADVYEWERGGGSQAGCEALGAELHLAASGGCLSLVSSGESPSDSAFLDASADGRDVFFTTAASLLPSDPGLVDVYDAREGGGFPQPAQVAACEGEACQSPPEAPNDPAPGSSSYEGPGNPPEAPAPKPHCKKPHCKKHHHKHKRHRRANHKRRAAR